ncbi:MAG: glutamate-1-semialdehyde 2,1-aminomutase [Chlamydiales bacterium]|nr:glutamate-1-semialdehyde 2,1-aminomutase [Chlamydiales bacterium]
MKTRSNEALQRLRDVLPGGVNSPIRSFPRLTPKPLVAAYGKGDMIYDVDDKGYIDYCMSWGSLILGHCHEAVTRAAKEQIDKGSSFGLSTEIEQQIAQKVMEIIPSIEMIRFVSSGTESTMSAARLARGYTKKNKIIKFVGNYHGHADQFMVSAGSYLNLLDNTPSTLGIPKESVIHTIVLPFNDIEALKRFFQTSPDVNDIAGCILEPVPGNIGVLPPSDLFMTCLREELTKIGALLIFDEVITGFRVHPQGAQGIFHVKPDLICLGKIIGGGYPAAAFGGSKEIMRHLAPLGSIFQAGTLSGNPVAMQSGLATLKQLQEPLFYQDLFANLDRLLNPIVSYIRDNNLAITMNRVGGMFSFFFTTKEIKTSHDLKYINHERFDAFFTFLLDKGIYFSPSAFEANFISSAHTIEHIEYTKDTILAFFKENKQQLK